MPKSTLVHLKKYLECGKHGRKVNLNDEMKPLTTEDRDDLLAELDKVDGVVFDLEPEQQAA